MPNITHDVPAIDARDVTKTFGDVVALDGLSMTVARGEVVGLLGPNGAGKTTIINVMSTLLTPDRGTVTVAGHDVVTDSHAVRESIALTGQFAAVDDMLTGAENLIMFGRLRGLTKKAATARAEELLTKFSLTEAATKRVGTYSGGMRRRLDLAASLVVPADVIFLDEPTTGLDPRSRNELWDVVRELRDDGFTIVLTTQYLEEADQLAERIIVIDRGRVIARGTPEELKETAGGRCIVATPSDEAHAPALAEALRRFGDATVDDDAKAVTVQRVGSATIAPVALAAQDAGIELADLSVRVPSLDDVFLQLTEKPRSADGAPSQAVAS